MRIILIFLYISIVNSQSINLEINNDLFLFIKEEVLQTVIQNLKHNDFTIDDGMILSPHDSRKYYLNLGGSEYYIYHYDFQLDSVEIEKFEINERNEFEIVLTNVVLKKLILELEIYHKIIGKLLSRFVRLEFKEKQNSGRNPYRGTVIERFQAQIVFVPSRKMTNNIPFIKIRSSDAKVNFKNIQIEKLSKKSSRFERFESAGFRKFLVKRGVSFFNNSIQQFIKWFLKSLLEQLLNYALKKCYVEKYEIKEEQTASAAISPFDQLDYDNESIYEPTEMDESFNEYNNEDDELFFDANLYETPIIGGINNKRMLLKFKGFDSQLERFKRTIEASQYIYQDDDEQTQDYPIAQVLIKERLVKSLKNVKKQFLKDILNPLGDDEIERLLRV